MSDLPDVETVALVLYDFSLIRFASVPTCVAYTFLEIYDLKE